MNKINSPKVTVVICTYNRCNSVRDTVMAMQNQQIPVDMSLEILVVDNNSTDKTEEVIRECSGKGCWPVHYLTETDQGKSYAQNTGILAAKGDVVVFLDDDVIPASNWLKELCDAFCIYEADVVGGPVQPLWSSEPPEWLKDPKLQFGMLALLDRGDQPIIAAEKERAEGNFLFGSNLAVKRSIFSEIGLFRTDLGRTGSNLAGGEDSEMVRRLLTAGKRLVYVPTAIVKHKIPSERMTLAYLRKWNFWMAKSTVRISEFKRVNPGVLVLECAKSMLVALCYYLTSSKLKAIGAEINFWWKFGMLVELLLGRKYEGKV